MAKNVSDPVCFSLDEHIPSAVAEGLRHRGVEAEASAWRLRVASVQPVPEGRCYTYVFPLNDMALPSCPPSLPKSGRTC